MTTFGTSYIMIVHGNWEKNHENCSWKLIVHENWEKSLFIYWNSKRIEVISCEDLQIRLLICGTCTGINYSISSLLKSFTIKW